MPPDLLRLHVTSRRDDFETWWTTGKSDALKRAFDPLVDHVLRRTPKVIPGSAEVYGRLILRGAFEAALHHVNIEPFWKEVARVGVTIIAECLGNELSAKSRSLRSIVEVANKRYER